MTDSVLDFVSVLNAEGYVVNGMSQLNKPTGVIWSVSIFRRESTKTHAYSYFQSQDEDLMSALKDAHSKGERRRTRAGPQTAARKPSKPSMGDLL